MNVFVPCEGPLLVSQGMVTGHAETPARDALLNGVRDRVFRYLRKLTGGDLDLSDELAQETMVRVVEGRDGLRDPQSLVPWALRIATNLWRDGLRRPRELRRAVEPAAPAGDEARAELAGLVVALLSELPDFYREALTLRYLEGLEYDVMSRILDVPVPTLRSHIARGRHLIRRLLEDAEEILP